jgi:hypothetical protein
VAATLPDLVDPAGEARSAMRGHRASAATNRAGKSGASHRVSAKIVLWRVETLDRIPRYALRVSPTIARLLLETRLMRTIQTVSKALSGEVAARLCTGSAAPKRLPSRRVARVQENLEISTFFALR